MEQKYLPNPTVRGLCSLGRVSLAVPAIFLLTALLGTIAPRSDDAGQADIVPNGTIQATIESFVEAEDAAQRQAAFEQLAQLSRSSTEQLVRQLTYFSSRARDTKHAMAAGAILRRLEVSDESIARSLVDCLETTDVEVAKTVRSVLGGLEKRSADRRPDFSIYRGIVAERVRNRETLPAGLIRYMYDADAGMALLAMMRAHQLREPEQIKRVLWAEHVVADVLWKQQFGFLKGDEVEPAAIEQLRLLATHDAWWARLYVAEVMRQRAPFRRAELLNTLSSDANLLVRESAGTKATTQPAQQP